MLHQLAAEVKLLQTTLLSAITRPSGHIGYRLQDACINQVSSLTQLTILGCVHQVHAAAQRPEGACL